ncbi:Tryptophan aminotransferase-related protein 4 [Vitis vinifera]|uniref:Tryptophan aminotransferase-related protein 4 n=1 Tax=Vitis vinifera TaxID=29760 RepID=A0A438DPQ7_VITVI|nr:Tryptophan aminotransferase-related protein 4 [Vitis vinifera]
MGKIQSCMYVVCLLCSVTLNILFVGRDVYVGGKWEVGWSRRAAEEAEAVAAVSCSAMEEHSWMVWLLMEVLFVSAIPALEALIALNFQLLVLQMLTVSLILIVLIILGTLQRGSAVLEPFWMQHAASSAVLVAGWHRMSYSFNDHSSISQELVKLIRKLHAIVGNANTTADSLFSGPALPNFSMLQFMPSHPIIHLLQLKLLPQSPFTRFINHKQTSFDQWTSSLQLNKAVLQVPNAKPIYDHAYYWPHFTPIPAPADEDLMIFTISKLTGHAGSRFGWALIKDKDVYETMLDYMSLNTVGVSRDTQLRAFKLLKVVTQGRGREIFKFGKFTSILYFFGKVKRPSPAYAWLKCEKEEDKECYGVLKRLASLGVMVLVWCQQ